MNLVVPNFKKYRGKGIDPKLIADAIEKGYVERNRDRHTQKTGFSMSTVVYGHGHCARYWYYAFRGTHFKEIGEPKDHANMLAGIAAHERLQSVMKGSVTEVEREITYDDPPIRGYVDVVMPFREKDAFVEIKTTRNEVFQHRVNTMKPPIYNDIQLKMYMYLEGVEDGAFVYENKNDFSLLIMPVHLSDKDKEELEKILDWMRMVWKNKDKLPTRKYRSNARQCKTCPVRDVCYEDSKQGEIDLENLPEF